MRNIILAIIVTTVSACSSVIDFERNAVTMSRLDTLYCEASGFKSFQDLGAYWSFICNDGRKFIVRYD